MISNINQVKKSDLRRLHKVKFWFQAAELFELATAAGLQPKSEPHWTAGYE